MLVKDLGKTDELLEVTYPSHLVAFLQRESAWKISVSHATSGTYEKSRRGDKDVSGSPQSI